MNAVYAKDEGRPAQAYPFTSLSYILPIPQDVIDQNLILFRIRDTNFMNYSF